MSQKCSIPTGCHLHLSIAVERENYYGGHHCGHNRGNKHQSNRGEGAHARAKTEVPGEVETKEAADIEHLWVVKKRCEQRRRGGYVG